MSTIDIDLAALGLSQYHLDRLVSEFASFNRPFCIRYGDNNPSIPALDDETSSLLRLTPHYIFNHLIGRFRIKICSAPIMKYYSINIFGSKEQVLEYLGITLKDIGVPLIVVTRKSKYYSCYYFLSSFEDKKSICEAVDYYLEKILDPVLLQRCETFPGSVKWLELPFGPGCYFFDPNTVEPMKMTKKKMIEYYFSCQEKSNLTLEKLLLNAEGLSYE